MLFKLEYTILELFLDLNQSDSLRLDYDDPHQITVELRIPTLDEQTIGHSKDNPFGTAVSIVEPPENISIMFASLAANRLPTGSKKTDRWPEYISPDGEIKENYVVPLSLLPEAFQQFAEQIRTELSDYL